MRKTIKKHTLNWNQWHFPFCEKLRFEFLEIFIDEWKSIFWNLQTQEQPRQVYPNFRKFLTRNFFPKFDFPSGIFGWMVCFAEIQ